MLKRKLKKLIRDPKLFISDMMINNAKKRSTHNKKVTQGHYSYTVVSAVYNSGLYLDDYFKSFVKQNLNFQKNIKLILVDDGSVDNSASVIKKWQAKYPQNIQYIYKENGGQASARNVGLENVNTDWVTFIDSDDFLSQNYFSSVDELLSENKNLKMVCCNQIYYFEEDNTYIDRHPLNYRFKNNKTILPLNDLGRHMQFSAPLAFFKVNSIPKNLRFDETLKPTFEDGKFVAHYILANQSSYICFYETPRYYNRKRSDKSSTMDNAWFNKGQYSVVLENGYIPTLQNYLEQLGHIPKFMQRTILWEMLRLIKHLVNQEHNVSFLSQQEKDKFLSLMDKTFSYIESQTILSFELGSCGFSRQVGMLGCFKKEAPETQVVYIEKFDANKKLLLVRYFTCKKSLEQFELNSEDIIPAYEKITSRKFLSRDFLLEKRMWLPIDNIGNGLLSIKIDGKPTSINYFGKKHKGKVNISDLKKQKISDKEIWLFMDRDDSAGDNAEYLYDYCQKNTDKEIYFILSKKSSDWDRLNSRGFNLIDHNSNAHKELLTKCTKAISSHVGPLINSFTDIKVNYSNIFLQHGVTKDDISNWINNCSIDLMITATDNEHNEIIKNNSPYIYGEKEVKKTGFPRFDSLLESNNYSGKKKILIMPTWRKSISGVFVTKGSSERVLNEDFLETNYAKAINSLLTNKNLNELAKKYNFEIVFCPHPNMRPYLNHFKHTDAIKLATAEDSIHQLLKESSYLITDYSSVAFDFAYMKKPLCYYQFDEESFFSGEHTYGKGYYNYREHGFGAVISTEHDLIEEIDKIAKNNFSQIDEKYISIINSTFETVDTNNCKRVLNAILDMEIPHSNVNTDILEEFAEQATLNKNWPLATVRWGNLSQSASALQQKVSSLKLTESLRESGRINNANIELSELDLMEYPELLSIYYIEQAKTLMACHRWEHALEAWNQVDTNLPAIKHLYIKCLSETKNTLQLKCLESSFESISFNALYIIYIARCHMSYDNWNEAIDTIKSNIHAFSPEEILEYKPDLILSRCYREVSNFDEAHIQLTKYESYAKNDVQHRFEISQLAFCNNHWNKVISQFDKIAIDSRYLPDEINIIHIQSLRFAKQHLTALQILKNITTPGNETIQFKAELAEIYSDLKEWDSAANLWIQLIGIVDNAYYRLAESYRMIGLVDEGLDLLLNERNRLPATLKEWYLRAELSQLTGNWQEAEHSWSSIIKFYPSEATKENWNQLYNAQLMNTIKLNKITLNTL